MVGTAGPNLGLVTGYTAHESGWGVGGFNPNFDLLDAITFLQITAADIAAPPGSPAAGDRYVVASGGSGAWSGHDDDLAIYRGGIWNFYTPKAGWRAYNLDTSSYVRFNGSAWVSDAGGGSLTLDDLTDVDTSGAISGDAIVFNGSTWEPGAGGGGGSSDITATFDSSTSTVMTLTAFAGAAAIDAALTDGEGFRVFARIKKNTGSHVGLILSTAKNATDGYVFLLQTDGNIVISTASVSIAASGTGQVANHNGWIDIEATIVFNSAGYNWLVYPIFGARPQLDNTLNFIASPLWCAIYGVSSAADIGTVRFTPLQ